MARGSNGSNVGASALGVGASALGVGALALGVGALALGLLGGCDSDGVQRSDDSGGGSSGTPENPDPHATVLATVDPTAACNDAAVTEVVLRARRVGCEQGPPAPCTVANPPNDEFGTRLTCPSTQSEAILAVEVDVAGRYAVDLVTRLTTGEPTTVCYALPGAATGDTDVLVTMADLDARSEIGVRALDDVCAFDEM